MLIRCEYGIQYKKNLYLRGISLHTVKNNVIDDTVLYLWSEKFVPDIDYFYFKEVPSYFHVEDRKDIELLLDTKTSFLTWNVLKDAKYVAIVSNKEFQKLEDQVKKQILLEQAQIKRGFVFTLDELEQLQKGPLRSLFEPYIFTYNNKECVILQGFIWKNLPKNIQADLLIRIAGWFTDKTSISKKELGKEWETLQKANHYIASYFNTFIGLNGPNCLGATLASIQQKIETAELYLNKWVHTEEFYKVLKENRYNKTDSTAICKYSILVWEKDNQAIHACYMISEDLVFNKNGQTMFNPYQCLKISDVIDTWKWVVSNGGKLSIYQKR